MKSFKREIIETGDGSKTFYLPQLDETYHSHHGAYNESLHIFINNGLKPINKSEVNIFEVGFGTGLNAILTLIHKGSKNINYDGIELYPVHLSDLNQIDYWLYSSLYLFLLIMLILLLYPHQYNLIYY